MATVNGTPGNDFVHVRGDRLTAPVGFVDNQHATKLGDFIDSGGSGFDIVNAGGGNDVISFDDGVNDIDSADRVYGSKGFDTLRLFNPSVTFGAFSMDSIEQLAVTMDDNGATVVMHDNNVAAKSVLTVGFSADLSMVILARARFDGSAEQDGSFNVFAASVTHDNINFGDGNSYIGGAKSDSFFNCSVFDGVEGRGGNDTIMVHDVFGRNAFFGGVTGGAGFDTLFFESDNIDLQFFFNGIEKLVIAPFFLDPVHYTLGDDNVAAGETLIIDATAVGLASGGAPFVLDDHGEQDGMLSVIASLGNDSIRTGAGGDTIDVSQGGDDTVGAGGEDDFIQFLTKFTTDDEVNGGNGFDYVDFTWTAASSLVLGAKTIANVEALRIAAGFGTPGTISLTTNNANVAAGERLTIDASTLFATTALRFQGRFETDGSFTVIGGAGDDDITGGSRRSLLEGHGGDDLLQGGFGGDTLNGGLGIDTASYRDATRSVTADLASPAVNLGAAKGDRYVAIENLEGSDFLDDLRGDGGNNRIAGGDGRDTLAGRGGNDDLSGEAGNDILSGGKGIDVLRGGLGADRFVYAQGSESTNLAHDTLVGIDLSTDRFDLNVAISGIDAAVGTGNLSAASFRSDLANALKLVAHHAVLFAPDAGSFANRTFIVADANGRQGYQSGDYVFEVTGGSNLNKLDVGDFV